MANETHEFEHLAHDLQPSERPRRASRRKTTMVEAPQILEEVMAPAEEITPAALAEEINPPEKPIAVDEVARAYRRNQKKFEEAEETRKGARRAEFEKQIEGIATEFKETTEKRVRKPVAPRMPRKKIVPIELEEPAEPTESLVDQLNRIEFDLDHPDEYMDALQQVTRVVCRDKGELADARRFFYQKLEQAILHSKKLEEEYKQAVERRDRITKGFFGAVYSLFYSEDRKKAVEAALVAGKRWHPWELANQMRIEDLRKEVAKMKARS